MNFKKGNPIIGNTWVGFYKIIWKVSLNLFYKCFIEYETKNILSVQKSVAASYFTNQRLKYFNDSVNKMRPDVDRLVTSRIDTSPINSKVNDIESEARGINRKVSMIGN